MLKRKKIAIIYFCCVIMLSSIELLAQDLKVNPKKDNTPGKHSAIVEADGYAYLSEDKTIRQLRQEALANAKREALQRGETHIKSFTRVENYQLTYDLIQSESEGYVKILESKDYGITSDNRYRYWIKAEIEYRVKSPDAQKIDNIPLSPAGPLTVSVWTEKVIYKEGEEIKIFLQGNKDFYARVIYVDAQKNVVQLIPNQHRTDNYFKGGKTLTIPEPFDGFKLEVGPPFGKEKIIIYASSAPQGNIQTAAFGKSLYQVKSDLNTVGMKTRGVIIKKTSAGASEGAEFFETSCELETRK